LRLLVFGGSQGARRINQVFLEALPALISLPGGVEIVHATGEEDREWVEEAYREHGFPARVEAFLTEMAPAYATADLVISRAGATTCAELTALGKPAILIPFPRAAGGHQDLNAEQLREAGAAVMIPEPELGPERLAEMVRDLASEPDRLREMATASRGLGLPDAAKRVANLAEELMNARGKTAA
jgi:UDP-N-acetylglucosamine--N-acetylmuramyl-(pentapeptide) pyrophosphoryl-undecaprenol N-acetylglucosamine transferase